MPDDVAKKLTKEQSDALAREAEEMALRALSAGQTRGADREAINRGNQETWTARKNAESRADWEARNDPERFERLYRDIHRRHVAEDPAEAWRAEEAEMRRQQFLQNLPQ